MCEQDEILKGFLDAVPNAARYNNSSESPYDVAFNIALCLPKNAYVLDIGCGTGSTAIVYKKYSGCHVIGIEPDSDRAEIARSRGLEVINGYFTKEIKNMYGLFDVIVLADVIEHLSDPSEMLLQIRQVLSANGFIIVSLPNVAHWSVRIKLLMGKFNYDNVGIMDATHLRWFTLESAEKYFKNIGFDVVYVSSTVNASLPIYKRLFPFKLLSIPNREKLLAPFTKLLPTLFGCQHIFVLR